MNTCHFCSTTLQYSAKKYCSNACQNDDLYTIYIDSWKNGKQNGLRGREVFSLSAHIRRYIYDKYKGSCAKCHWSEINPLTGVSPLEIDHIDGNSTNNIESNLVLLCPNCHALTSTYKNLNRGKGRAWRRDKYVKIV